MDFSKNAFGVRNVTREFASTVVGGMGCRLVETEGLPTSQEYTGNSLISFLSLSFAETNTSVDT